jgi:hypothetical protein
MIYILDKTGRVVGSANSPVDPEDLAGRNEVAVASDLDLPIERLDVVGDPSRPTLVARAVPSPPKIVLSTSAEDTDEDGLAELPADGESKAEITALLNDGSGELIKDHVQITFRTSAGTLSARYVSTSKGKAAVELTSSHETVMATVSASAAGFEAGSIEFEFLPVPVKTTTAKGKK